MLSVGTTVTFEASHYLPFYDGVCNNLHGHSYKLEISVTDDNGEEKHMMSGVDYVNPNEHKFKCLTGMVLDMKILKNIVKEVTKELDHKHLNTVISNPTAENILMWLYYHLAGKLEEHYQVHICHMKLWETETNFAEYWR